jgi:SRSO17 transposase
MGLRAAEDSESRFVAYVEGLVSVIGHADRAGPLRDYCTGLMMPCERKSVEPMAAVTAPARVGAQHQKLLHFVGEPAWSDARVLAKVREMVLPAIERHGPIEAWIIDDTGFPKQGRGAAILRPTWRALPDPHLVLKPHLYRCVRREPRSDFRHALGEVFLNASMASGACL